MSVSPDQDRLAELERQLRGDLQDQALAHRWLNQLERAPAAFRDRSLVVDLLHEIARRFPSDRRLVAGLEERWLASGRNYAGRSTVEDWYRDFLLHTSEPPGALSDLGVLAVPAITRTLRGQNRHHIDGCIQALYRMGTEGSSAFEDLLELSDHCSDSWCFHSALYAIEPDKDRAARRLQDFQSKNPTISLAAVFRRGWNLLGGTNQSDWLASLAAVCKVTDNERAVLDQQLFAGRFALRDKLLEPTVLARIANLVGDQPHYLKNLWTHWHRISMTRRQPIIDALRKLQARSNRLRDSILYALEKGLILPSRLKAWPWTHYRGALRLVTALKRASTIDAERRHCAQALAALCIHQEARLSNERDLEKLRPLSMQALELARELALDADPSTSRFALRALSRLASNPLHDDRHPENRRILRDAILGGDLPKLKAAATTGLWPLSPQDLKSLQAQIPKLRTPLRRALGQLRRAPEQLLSSPVRGPDSTLESDAS